MGKSGSQIRLSTLPIVLSSLMLLLIHSPAVCQDQKTDERLWLQLAGGEGPGAGKHVVLISGDDEYRSEESLPMLAKILSIHHGFKCSVLFPVNDSGLVQPDHQTRIPGMQLLESADVLILGLRFRNLPESDMRYFADYVESGKPVIGLRTSTHAFQIPNGQKYSKYSWNFRGEGWDGGFGQRVLGDTWINHHGKHGVQSTRGVIAKKFQDHPVLIGVSNVWGPSDVYAIQNLPDSATILMFGQVLNGMKPDDEPVEGKPNEPMMPLAWVRTYRTESGQDSRIFCTTMGAATDFESAGLRRLIVNATFWSARLDAEIRPDLNVDCVDGYQPTDFGFKAYQKGLRPADFDLKSRSR